MTDDRNEAAAPSAVPRRVGPWRKASASNPTDCVQLAEAEGGGTLVRDSKLGDSSPVLHFTPSEMKAFILGATAGEFNDFTDV